ncbi:MAG: hypothetical protein HY395_02360 [Candidatus Doudnabacteria bacterium]|nr:hypothetical protein [Candidatus Doudnabacteria bacterium]
MFKEGWWRFNREGGEKTELKATVPTLARQKLEELKRKQFQVLELHEGLVSKTRLETWEITPARDGQLLLSQEEVLEAMGVGAKARKENKVFQHRKQEGKTMRVWRTVDDALDLVEERISDFEGNKFTKYYFEISPSFIRASELAAENKKFLQHLSAAQARGESAAEALIDYHASPQDLELMAQPSAASFEQMRKQVDELEVKPSGRLADQAAEQLSDPNVDQRMHEELDEVGKRLPDSQQPKRSLLKP